MSLRDILSKRPLLGRILRAFASEPAAPPVVVIRDTTPPIISNITVGSSTEPPPVAEYEYSAVALGIYDAIITWATSEPATTEITVNELPYFDGVLKTSHTILVSELPALSTLKYSITATDASGNTSGPVQGSFAVPAAGSEMISEYDFRTAASFTGGPVKGSSATQSAQYGWLLPVNVAGDIVTPFRPTQPTPASFVSSCLMDGCANATVVYRLWWDSTTNSGLWLVGGGLSGSEDTFDVAKWVNGTPSMVANLGLRSPMGPDHKHDILIRFDGIQSWRTSVDGVQGPSFTYSPPVAVRQGTFGVTAGPWSTVNYVRYMQIGIRELL
jgi:hypothetical protein